MPLSPYRVIELLAVRLPPLIAPPLSLAVIEPELALTALNATSPAEALSVTAPALLLTSYRSRLAPLTPTPPPAESELAPPLALIVPVAERDRAPSALTLLV